MFIYPENLKAKPMLWLWLLRDIAVIGMPTVNWTALFGLVNAVGIFFYPDVV